MPYIAQPARNELDAHINAISDIISSQVKDKVDIAGILNYCITRLILRSFRLCFGAQIRYWMSPMIRGVLQDVGDEFYYRKMRKYEDGKIVENGDVLEYKD